MCTRKEILFKCSSNKKNLHDVLEIIQTWYFSGRSLTLHFLRASLMIFDAELSGPIDTCNCLAFPPNMEVSKAILSSAIRVSVCGISTTSPTLFRILNKLTFSIFSLLFALFEYIL